MIRRMTIDDIDALQADMDDLQTWCTLLMSNRNPVPRSRQAWDVIQRARIAIVELRQLNCSEFPNGPNALIQEAPHD